MLNHSFHPQHSIHPVLLRYFTTSSALVVCRLEDSPRSLTQSHTQTHTSAMCHYPFHLPLLVIPCSQRHEPTLATSLPRFLTLIYQFPESALRLSFHSSMSSIPPQNAMCHHCREERNMHQSTSEKTKEKAKPKRRRE